MMKTKSISWPVLIGCLIPLTLAISGLPALAQTPSTYWVSTEDTDWFNCDNWTNGCPDNTKDTYISNGFKSQITSAEGTARSLTLGLNLGESGQLLVDSVHGSLIVAQGGESPIPGDVYVGNVGIGVLNITGGGSVTCGNAYIAASASPLTTSSSVTVSGAGSRWTMSYLNSGGQARLYVGGSNAGNGGAGLLTVSNGGTVEVGDDTNAAAIRVLSSGTVTGNGSITMYYSRQPIMVVFGTIEPSNGTLFIGGNLVLYEDATTVSNVTPQAADNLDITGTSSLDGRLSVTMTGDFASAPTQYTLLHASAGLSNTRFFSVSIMYPTGHGWHPTITYDPPDDPHYVHLNRIFDLHP
jgi:hypothetical protein